MNFKIKIIMLLMAFVSTVSVAQAPLTATKYIKTHPVKTVVKAVDNKNNQNTTRITVSLISQPNTSSRIDSAHFVNGNEQLRAVDIDGVDFGRYFQWEEDGMVSVDVDFPRRNKFVRDAVVVLHTVHGDLMAPLAPVFKSKVTRK